MRILRGGLFERVSTEEQSKFGFSIQNQIEALEEYCKDNKIKIVDHYTDEGVSGGAPYQKRPEMKRLIDDVEAGKIDIILFTRLDRWFRNVQEYYKVQEILDRHKVEWKAIWEDYDTSTSNGRMAITIFLAIAQNEREKTAERIKSVFDSKRRRKESFFGANATPFGYIEVPDENGIKRCVKDPEVEDALQTFWDIAVKYENVDKACKVMTLEYGLTKTRSKWHELVKKEIYTGTYKGVEDYCPAYVSKENWNKLQGRGLIKKAQCDRIYLFTGLIKCPKCGRKMTSTYCKQTRSNGDIVEYYNYRCNEKMTGACKYKSTISQNKIEKYLLKNLDELVRNEIAEVEIQRTKPKTSNKPKANLVAKLKEQLRRLEVVYLAGNKSDEEYLKEQKELNDAITKAEVEMIVDGGNRDLTPLRELLETDFRSLYESLEPVDKRRFWRELIKEIKVEGNTVVSVVFH